MNNEMTIADALEEIKRLSAIIETKKRNAREEVLEKVPENVLLCLADQVAAIDEGRKHDFVMDSITIQGQLRRKWDVPSGYNDTPMQESDFEWYLWTDETHEEIEKGIKKTLASEECAKKLKSVFELKKQYLKTLIEKAKMYEVEPSYLKIVVGNKWRSQKVKELRNET